MHGECDMALPNARPTSASLERAARHIHASLLAHRAAVDGSSALESIVRETGATNGDLVFTTNRVLTQVERLDAIGVEPNRRHDDPTPLHDGSALAEALAGALSVRVGVPMMVLCAHRYPIDEVPDWCRAGGGFTIVPDMRGSRPHHP